MINPRRERRFERREKIQKIKEREKIILSFLNSRPFLIPSFVWKFLVLNIIFKK